MTAGVHVARFRKNRDSDDVAQGFPAPSGEPMAPGAAANAVGPRRPSGGTPLGDLLVEEGLVTRIDLEEALAVQAQTGDPLGLVLIKAGHLNDDTLRSILALQQNLVETDLRHGTPDPDALALVPEELARRYAVLPFNIADGTLIVVTADPHPGLAEDLGRELQMPVAVAVANRLDVDRLMSTYYQALSGVDAQVAAFLDSRTSTGQSIDLIDDRADDAPVVRVVDMILSQAVRERASDVHLESRDRNFVVRFRIDGALRDMSSLPVQMAGPVCGRIKVMAGMNIVERRRPQDGQIGMKANGNDLDIRVSSVGTVWGEKLVLRLLDRSKPAMRLSQLGMSEESQKRFSEAIATPFGMVVCAGPTGSGKTTTLYASLREIDAVERSITTIEDPVEYMFPGITQISINEAAGVTFASGLRATLRQDPDVILVGEIRDQETARIAIQAALTGHLVFSSLHATDSVSALYRFIDMGVEPFLVASSVRAIVGQRLVRRLCTGCSRSHQLTAEEEMFWEAIGGPSTLDFRTADGCNRCGGTGYVDRVGIYEVLTVNDVIAEAIMHARPSTDAMRALAVNEGLISLRAESIRLVDEGVTSVYEILRSIHTL